MRLQIGIAAAAYGAILFAMAAIEEVLMRGLWRPFDIASYYGLAESAVSSMNAVLSTPASSPLLLLDIYGLRMPAVFLLAWACAVLVMAIGSRLYGANAGMLAGLLFTLSIAGAQGHASVSEAMALALVLSSVYCLLCAERQYLAAGLLAGTAVCMKPLAAVLLPLSIFYFYRKKNISVAAIYGSAWALPLVLIAIIAFDVYGGDTITMATSSGFETFGFYSGQSDALMAAANIALAACMLASLLPLALLGFYRTQGLAGKYILAAGLLFIATLLLKQYLEYWLFALPFLALLCASAFARRPADA